MAPDLTSSILNRAGSNLSRSSLGKSTLGAGLRSGQTRSGTLKKIAAAAKDDPSLKAAAKALRGRSVSRESAVEGLKKAEKLGLLRKGAAQSYHRAISHSYNASPGQSSQPTVASDHTELLRKGSSLSRRLSKEFLYKPEKQQEILDQVEEHQQSLQGVKSAEVHGQATFLKGQVRKLRQQDAKQRAEAANAEAIRQSVVQQKNTIRGYEGNDRDPVQRLGKKVEAKKEGKWARLDPYGKSDEPAKKKRGEFVGMSRYTEDDTDASQGKGESRKSSKRGSLPGLGGAGRARRPKKSSNSESLLMPGTQLADEVDARPKADAPDSPAETAEMPDTRGPDDMNIG